MQTIAESITLNATSSPVFVCPVKDFYHVFLRASGDLRVSYGGGSNGMLIQDKEVMEISHQMFPHADLDLQNSELELNAFADNVSDSAVLDIYGWRR